MALRKKWTQLASLAPDVAVIQECETPDRWPQGEYTSAVWHGKNQHKGLAVITFSNWRLDECEQLDPTIEYVLPVHVTGPWTFNLMGVWTKESPIKGHSYIGQMQHAAHVYGDWLTSEKSTVIGDWNSNTQWDRPGRNCHAATVAQLAKYEMTSAYHHYYHKAQGDEQHYTCYLTKNAERGFHIDYCFIPVAWTAHLRAVTVGRFDQWRQYSDHCPIIVDFVE